MKYALQKLQMFLTPGEIHEMGGTDKGKTIEASSDAIVLANAIHDLAFAVREHAKAMNGEDIEVDDSQFDLVKNRIHT